MIKRKIIFTLLLSLICMPCFADDEPAKPSWEEFCPKQYLDMKTLTPEEYSQKFYRGIFKPTKKHLEEYNKSASYWVTRKQHFNDYVNKCLTLPLEPQSVCFMKVRESEFEENRKMHFTPQDQLNAQGEMSERFHSNQMMKMNNQMRNFNPMY